MNDPGIDLTGKLIIKVALGDDIRRILITNEDITYDELILMMQRVYRGKLSGSDDIVIKYKDEDNDLITIFDSSDLTFAIQCSRILKITLFVNGKPEPLQTEEIKFIKYELKQMRDRCNKLLDKLDERQPQDPTSTTAADSSSSGVKMDNPKPVIHSPRHPSPAPRMPPPTSVAGSKEFDPLSTQRSIDDSQNKVMSSFGISGDVSDRPGTPDSIGSVGSSSGQRQQPQPVGGQSQPGTPAQQGTPSGMYAPGSGQKIPPWQSPSSQPQGQPQGQPGQYPGQQAPGFPPSSLPQQQQQGYPGHPQTSQPQNISGVAPTSHTQGFPVAAPTSQAQSFPGGAPAPAQAPAPAPSSQPGYGTSSTPQYSGYSQQGGQGQVQSFPGPQQQPQQLPFSQGQGQQVQPGQPGQQQQQPSPYGYSQPQQPQQQPMSAPGQTSGNPYARQAPGYAGYPRPGGTYPPGYQ